MTDSAFITAGRYAFDVTLQIQFLNNMISKFPRWVWSGIASLSFIAGFVNIIGLLGFERQSITHLTGNTSLLGASLAEGQYSAVIHYGGMLLAFVTGCTISGFIIQDTALKIGRRYGVALLLDSVLLFVSIPLSTNNNILGMYAAACACGLQNAMVSNYSGAAVRTTHVSGMYTDLGIFLGHFIRGMPVDSRRLRLCLIVISGFLGGGFAGTLAFQSVGYKALCIPATLTLAASASYTFYSVRNASN